MSRTKRGHRFIRNIDLEIWNQFRQTVIEVKGQSRKTFSLVTDELEELLKFYIKKGGRIHTQPDKLQVARARLKAKNQRLESVTKEDIKKAVMGADVRHPQTQANYIARLCDEFGVEKEKEKTIEDKLYSDDGFIQWQRKRIIERQRLKTASSPEVA